MKYLFSELQDEIQRYKDELEIAGMQAQWVFYVHTCVWYPYELKDRNVLLISFHTHMDKKIIYCEYVIRPGMMSVLEHQDILQVVELRAQQAEIKALQLENEVNISK